MTAETAARMAKATKIARALLAQGVAEGTDDFWACAAGVGSHCARVAS